MSAVSIDELTPGDARPHRRAGFLRWLAVGALVLVLTGCSATRLVYNQMDWLTIWYLNDYFSLDDDQEAQLRDIVERSLEWHRREQLPKYAQFCRELEAESHGVLTPELLENRYAAMVVLWDELLVHATPDIAAFFLMLSDEQVDEFIANLEDNNDELWEEHAGATPEERRARREKGAMKGAKRIIGRLTDEQEELIRIYMANMHDVSREWMESRRQWQQDFRQLVIERPAEPEFSARFMTLMVDPNKQDDPAYREKVDGNRDNMIGLTIALSETLTEKQHAKFTKRLLNFSRDFEILAVGET